MIKIIWGLRRNPELSLGEFSQHWFEVHGQHHVSAGNKMDGYIQQHHLYGAESGPVASNLDGVSVVRMQDLAQYHAATETPSWKKAAKDSRGEVRGNLPLLSFPWCFSITQEHVIVNGATEPLMVKLLTLVQRNPALPADRFYSLWQETGGARIGALPGVRRYVQNHAVDEARSIGQTFYDGFDEIWFDDLAALQAATAVTEWVAFRECRGLVDDNASLFNLAENAICIGRERTLKPYRPR